MRLSDVRLLSLLFLLLSSAISSVSAASSTVTSVASLLSAVKTAKSGDTINLAAGKYGDMSLKIINAGVTVACATIGGCSMTGAQTVLIVASDVTFRGFSFTSGSLSSENGIVVEVSSSAARVKIHANTFFGYNATKYLHLDEGTTYADVAYNTFGGKPATAFPGAVVQVMPTASTPNYHNIHHNTFRDFPGKGGDFGNEPIRIGLGELNDYTSRTVVEYNYFTNTGPGDSEAISSKSEQNIYRYNTFENNQNAMLCLRNGDDNLVYGNFFINAGGVRVKQANGAYIFNNYFENSAVGSRVTDALTLDQYSGYHNRIVVAHNTFVNSAQVNLGGADTSAVNIKFVDNIFLKSSGSHFTNTVTYNGKLAATFSGNIWSGGSLGLNPLPTSGFTNKDPLLSKDANYGYYRLAKSSPALAASSGAGDALISITGISSDSSIATDIAGAVRPSASASKDVGCQQFSWALLTASSATSAKNKPMSATTTGPSAYLSTSSTSSSKDAVSRAEMELLSASSATSAKNKPMSATTTGPSAHSSHNYTRHSEL